ncbi:hypothetical protein BDQ12DRAFT_687503 [Crucibulum laeve]|uniref:Uncharacterized protein n=1 Tax=Crucibulum laeve TaxID=68775 RepID=A0A5C3LUD0_9AGAR|nr:hypothetical protein BDQ12DRAFT_687503 [Crucibulum laeve]
MCWVLHRAHSPFLSDTDSYWVASRREKILTIPPAYRIYCVYMQVKGHSYGERSRSSSRVME